MIVIALLGSLHYPYGYLRVCCCSRMLFRSRLVSSFLLFSCICKAFYFYPPKKQSFFCSFFSFWLYMQDSHSNFNQLLFFLFHFLFFGSVYSAKANTNHTHGVAKQTSTLADNFFLTRLGNIAIISWWGGSINITQKDAWTTLYTLPCTNKGQTVWTNEIITGDSSFKFRVKQNSSELQYYCARPAGTVATIQSGQLIFFIE